MMIDTPDGMTLFRLTLMLNQLKLEQNIAPMRVTRGPKLRSRFAEELGLSPRAPYSEFFAAVQAKIDALGRPVVNREDCYIVHAVQDGIHDAVTGSPITKVLSHHTSQAEARAACAAADVAGFATFEGPVPRDMYPIGALFSIEEK